MATAWSSMLQGCAPTAHSSPLTKLFKRKSCAAPWPACCLPDAARALLPAEVLAPAARSVGGVTLVTPGVTAVVTPVTASAGEFSARNCSQWRRSVK